MRSDPRPLSLVVISRNEGSFLKRTVENLLDTLPGGAEIYRGGRRSTWINPRMASSASASIA